MDSSPNNQNLKKAKQGEEWKEWKERKPPLEEFFYLLVITLKLLHKERDLVIDFPSKEIFRAANRWRSLRFYDFIAFIQNYLDRLVIKIRYKSKRKPANIRRQRRPIKDPVVKFLWTPDKFQIIDGFFLKDRPNNRDDQ